MGSSGPPVLSPEKLKLFNLHKQIIKKNAPDLLANKNIPRMLTLDFAFWDSRMHILLQIRV